MTTTAINSTAGTRFSSPVTHAVPIKLPFDSTAPIQRGKFRQERLHLWLGSGKLHAAHFHTCLFVQSVHPFISFYHLQLPLSIFILGATQEGVYRTVGSNIQVQKLLNAFFGKKTSPSTSAQQGTALCRLCNLRTQHAAATLHLISASCFQGMFKGVWNCIYGNR